VGRNEKRAFERFVMARKEGTCLLCPRLPYGSHTGGEPKGTKYVAVEMHRAAKDKGSTHTLADLGLCCEPGVKISPQRVDDSGALQRATKRGHES